MMKLGRYVHCTKIAPEFEYQGQRSKFKVIRDKNKKLLSHFRLTMHSRACAIGHTQQGATVAWPLVGDGLRQWENQRMLSSLMLHSWWINVYT